MHSFARTNYTSLLAESSSTPLQIRELPRGESVLRIATAGSVDDGKSTLIGRLLYDARAIPDDQLAAIAGPDDSINFAGLTDGLRAEKEQGITIDVAYRFWRTPKRHFILADSPGHQEFTRNMITAASNADIAILVVDSRNGLLEQSRRHLYLSALLRVSHIIVCVNKMDLVGFDEATFSRIADGQEFLQNLAPEIPITFIPIAALHGDNVVNRSERTPWYHGPTLIQLLEGLPGREQSALLPARLPVQLVIRNEESEFRGYAGQIASGQFNTGDEIEILPARKRTRIKSLTTYDGTLTQASAPASVIVELEDQLDIARGNIISKSDVNPITSRQIKATVCWMDSTPSSGERTYLLKLGTQVSKAKLLELQELLDLQTLQLSKSQRNHLQLNEIGVLTINTQQILCFDLYSVNRNTGSFVLIDEQTGATAAAGLCLGTGEE